MAKLTLISLTVFLALGNIDFSSSADVPLQLEAFYFEGAPDGVTKQILGVNGQFPGPTIRAKKGDTLVVRVKNSIQFEGQKYNTSVHWHGLEMFLTPWFDGPEGVTQCSIPFGQSMEYRFFLENAGTYWYHSHHSWQYVEGFWGLLIVDNTPEVHKYDDEISVVISDWYHRTAIELSGIFHKNDSLNPVPDSGLINGRGKYDCSTLSNKSFTCDPTMQSPALLSVSPGKVYRVRVINTSARSRFNFSIDGHKLTAIETDGVDTEAVGPVDQVLIWPAQRYSFLINTTGTSEGYWIRAQMDGLDNIEEGRAEPLAKAILHYDGDFCPSITMSSSGFTDHSNEILDTTDGEQGRPAVHEFDWPGLMKEAETEEGLQQVRARLQEARRSSTSVNYVFPRLSPDYSGAYQAQEFKHQMLMQSISLPTTTPVSKPIILDSNLCRPKQRGSPSAYNYHDQQVVLNVSFANSTITHINTALINNISYSSTNSPPVLFRMLNDQEIHISSNPQNTTFLRRVIEVVINNDDFEGHPWHLHGHTFWVLGNGKNGSGPFEESRDRKLLSITGSRRDTTFTLPYSWAVVQFETNNPGAWLLHCHINWHLEVGLGVVFIEGERELKLLTLDPEAKRVCELNNIFV